MPTHPEYKRQARVTSTLAPRHTPFQLCSTLLSCLRSPFPLPIPPSSSQPHPHFHPLVSLLQAHLLTHYYLSVVICCIFPQSFDLITILFFSSLLSHRYSLFPFSTFSSTLFTLHSSVVLSASQSVFIVTPSLFSSLAPSLPLSLSLPRYSPCHSNTAST